MLKSLREQLAHKFPKHGKKAKELDRFNKNWEQAEKDLQKQEIEDAMLLPDNIEIFIDKD